MDYRSLGQNMRDIKKQNGFNYKQTLLSCTTLLAIATMQNFAYAQNATTPIPDISVTAPLPLDGSAAAGYRVNNTTAAGPIFSDLPIQDAPYSITVVPHELIDNLQAYQPEQLVKVIPQITNVLPQQNNSGNPFFYVRGFTITQFTNNAGMTYDGLLGGAGGMFDTVLEDKERLELLSGVDGFLYGTGSVGGNLNYVLKRPTVTSYASVTAGDNSGQNGYIHGDFGGPLTIPGLADGLVGYRLNVAGQDGHTSIYNQDIKRNLISGAIDVHLWDGALLQFNAAHSNYHVYGITPAFGVSAALTSYPTPANPATIFTPSWLQFVDETDTGGAKLTWKLNDIFSIRAAYDFTREQRGALGQGGSLSTSITNYQGTETQSASSAGTVPTIWYTHSGYSFLDAEFSTWGLQHKLTTGFTGFTQFAQQGLLTTTSASTAYTNNFYNQISVPQPNYAFSPSGSNYIYADTFGKNYVLGDEIKFMDKFILLAGANYTTLGRTNFNSAGTATSGYGASALTPSISLVYKVLPWLSTYATYQQSLQQGSQVLNSGNFIYTNNGATLSPYLGKQYEVGVKATVGTNLLVTAALFDIDKANQYTQNNGNGTYTVIQSGREVHKGLELTATGKIYEDLTLIAGLDLIDARITNNPTNPLQDGVLPQNVSPISGKLYAEYNPSFLPWARGLTLIGGFQAADRFDAALPGTTYASLINLQKLPGYIVGDLGFRYTTKVADKDLIIRFNVNNFTNTAYWQSYAEEGLPRTFLASAEMRF